MIIAASTTANRIAVVSVHDDVVGMYTSATDAARHAKGLNMRPGAVSCKWLEGSKARSAVIKMWVSMPGSYEKQSLQRWTNRKHDDRINAGKVLAVGDNGAHIYSNMSAFRRACR